MHNADILCSSQTEIFGEWFVAKPMTQPFFTRLKDAFKVLTGEAVGVTFTETVKLEEVVTKRVKDLIDIHAKYTKDTKNIEKSIKKSLDIKLGRELQKLGVAFAGDELKIGHYDILINNKKLMITTESNVMNVSDESELKKFYDEMKFKFIYSKIISVFNDIEKTKNYMLNPEVEDDTEQSTETITN